MKSTMITLAVALFGAAAAQNACRTYTDCASCLGQGEFCGWCSPAPTVFNNGTKGFQCQDQKESGWHCNHQYSTGKCLVGYSCNATSGQCYQTAAGKGDTKENCEKSCKKTPKPKGLSKCNLKSHTCEPCADYCDSDKDCPSSYCQAGLCHGSTCQSNSTCSSQCTTDTPDELIGTWRGVLVSKGFQMGEFDLKFQRRADGPQVQFKGPDGKLSSGSLQSDAATGGRDITITYTDGPLKGSVYSGAYDPWEPSTETLQTAFYFGAPSQPKPLDVATAMAGNGQTVYVMSHCNPHAAVCDFSSVFPKAIVRQLRALRALDMRQPTTPRKFLDEHPTDPCAVHPTCGSCIGDKTGLCGWCDNDVTYPDGTKGGQCAGFDSTGKPLGWTCKGIFHKDSCSDYGCDWTDIKNPKCVECTDKDECKLSKKDCAKACVAPPELYKCDTTQKPPKCVPCKSSYCTKDSDCPGSYCQKSGIGPWSCHGGVAPGCASNSSCTGSCGAKPVEEFYLCDKFSGQCKSVPKGTAGAQTKYECDHQCKAAAPTGTWRGVQVSNGFARGEFDFTFYDDATVHMRDADGKVFIAKFQGLNLTKAGDGAVTTEGTVTVSADTKALPVGTKLHAVFRVDGAGNDGIAQLLFWGMSTKGPVESLDAAMKQSEFVLVGCDRSVKTCDFSAAHV